MQKVTRAIIILTLCYLGFIAYAFGVFLQYPVVQGEILTIQAVIEPFVYVILMTIGNFSIFNAVYSQEKTKKQFFDEKRLLGTAIILLMLVVFGAGMHTTGQLIEETFVNSSTATQHMVGNFTSQVAYFLEEYPAHFLVAIPYAILIYFLAKVEFNRKRKTLKTIERSTIVICALFYGVVFAVLNSEGHVAPLMIPLNIFLLFKFYTFSKDKLLGVLTMPFSTFFIVPTFKVELHHLLILTLLSIPHWEFDNLNIF